MGCGYLEAGEQQAARGLNDAQIHALKVSSEVMRAAGRTVIANTLDLILAAKGDGHADK